MRKRTKSLIVASIVSVIFGYNYWQPELVKNVSDSTQLSDADYFFEKVKLKRFDESGQLASQLEADKMEHYRSSDQSQIETPKILIVSEDKSRWQIQSNSGQMNHKDNQLKLKQNIQLNQLESDSISRLEAEDLLVSLDSNTAVTNNNVVIESKNSRTQATGMDADFKKELIQLHGPVETEEVIHE